MSSMPIKTVMGTGTLRAPVQNKPAVSLMYMCNSDAFFQAEISQNSLAVSSIMEPSLIFHCASTEDLPPPSPSHCSHIPQLTASEMSHIAPSECSSCSPAMQAANSLIIPSTRCRRFSAFLRGRSWMTGPDVEIISRVQRVRDEARTDQTGLRLDLLGQTIDTGRPAG